MPCLPWWPGLEQPPQHGSNPRWGPVALSASCLPAAQSEWHAARHHAQHCILSLLSAQRVCTCNDIHKHPFAKHESNKSNSVYMKPRERETHMHICLTSCIHKGIQAFLWWGREWGEGCHCKTVYCWIPRRTLYVNMLNLIRGQEKGPVSRLWYIINGQVLTPQDSKYMLDTQK